MNKNKNAKKVALNLTQFQVRLIWLFLYTKFGRQRLPTFPVQRLIYYTMNITESCALEFCLKMPKKLNLVKKVYILVCC